jgi:hypothetical protein
MTEAYTAHWSGQYIFASHLAKRSTIVLQSCLVTAPTCPVGSLSRLPIEGFPEPQCAPLGLERVPHLIAFQGAWSPRRFWLFLILLGEGPEPVAYGLYGAYYS